MHLWTDDSEPRLTDTPQPQTLAIKQTVQISIDSYTVTLKPLELKTPRYKGQYNLAHLRLV